MAGLVADYSSSSEGESELELAKEISTRIADQKTVNYFESPGKKDTKKVKKNESKKQEVLANPLRKSAIPSPFESDSSASVFFNPFHKAQEDKKTVLEKHVKMTENPKDVLEINGKKICWNYRKGRCKFGHNCKYAHDSDISKPSDSKDMQNATGTVLHGDTLATQVPVTDAVIDELSTKKKKRPGLSDGIVPSKKVQKFHRKQQSKETPWLLKR
ncbi:uncharacterized protein LOC127000317 isoform X4 [Eriocheir sinensis]|uniref:uncharacterized protein LOC127000317 isoform X4 n=1 Tax=Eriocheir sinensis TaxID=95602 RepID=UPI0021C9A7A4|nr:uncharacterized protein LOC127000317 isoform X4 [Eriocheir sinensis]